MPYPLFVMIGSTLWQTFVRLLQSPLQAFNAGKPVFTKLKVPPEAFIAAGSARALFDFAIYAMTLIPILILFQTTPHWTILTLPLYLIALFALGTALGLLLIPIGSLYGDISQSIPLVMSFLMYMAPVVYPTPTSGLAATIIQWNPVTPLIMGARDAITGMSYENIIPACIILLACSVITFISLLSVRVAMPHLIARMGM